mmetsp:Transcript_24665/g.71221  ORF Transcript_24665/g.71221 Transcript_24665/m.71221 type:complete len:215 (+) Transcript_24665:861-1505(+)
MSRSIRNSLDRSPPPCMSSPPETRPLPDFLPLRLLLGRAFPNSSYPSYLRAMLSLNVPVNLPLRLLRREPPSSPALLSWSSVCAAPTALSASPSYSFRALMVSSTCSCHSLACLRSSSLNCGWSLTFSSVLRRSSFPLPPAEHPCTASSISIRNLCLLWSVSYAVPSLRRLMNQSASRLMTFCQNSGSLNSKSVAKLGRKDVLANVEPARPVIA